jgi:branched-chain amino acid transport system substrate-binding protein
VPESDELVAVTDDSLSHDGADRGVQAGAVAAACQNAEPHARHVSRRAGAPPTIAALPRTVTAVLSLALLAGCGGSDSPDQPEPVDADTLVIYSSLPRTGGSAEVGQAVAAGQRLALADTGERVGRYRIKLVELDSAEPDERDWDPDRVAENAGRAADDPATVAYLGELELGASAVSVPVTNEESILQVSPTDGLSSLTVPQSGPGAGPERFYPAEARNFLRLVPPDAAQAGPLVAVARADGATRLALVHDGGIFGKQLAGAVEQAAIDQGLEVTTVERVPDLEEAPELAEDIADAGADAVIYQGIGADPAATVLTAMGETEATLQPLIAAAPLARNGALPADEPADAVRVVSPLLPVRQYPAAGRRVLERLARRGADALPVEALYGYESMRLVLAALRAAGKRATDRAALIEAARTEGPRGSVIGRYRFDRRGDTSRRRIALYELQGGRLEYRGPAPGSGR